MGFFVTPAVKRNVVHARYEALRTSTPLVNAITMRVLGAIIVAHKITAWSVMGWPWATCGVGQYWMPSKYSGKISTFSHSYIYTIASIFTLKHNDDFYIPHPIFTM